jgi:hypothetical protein
MQPCRRSHPIKTLPFNRQFIAEPCGRLLPSLFKLVRFSKISFRFTKFTLAFVGEPAVVVGSIIRLQLDRLGVVADRFVVFLFVIVGEPAVVVALRCS